MVSKKKHTANKFQVVKAEILGIIDCCPDVISSAAFDRRIFFWHICWAPRPVYGSPKCSCYGPVHHRGLTWL